MMRPQWRADLIFLPVVATTAPHGVDGAEDV